VNHLIHALSLAHAFSTSVLMPKLQVAVKNLMKKLHNHNCTFCADVFPIEKGICNITY